MRPNQNRMVLPPFQPPLDTFGPNANGVKHHGKVDENDGKN